ncbi:hypothetical protein BGZ75_005107 [Mortierella antarctica]|nr:hypothetical protein BGZ75_005107 [Mortierella antarctica]
MHFFKKSSKNKTASAAVTPFHTPRTSLDESRPNTGNMTAKQQKEAQDAEVLYSLISKALSGGGAKDFDIMRTLKPTSKTKPNQTLYTAMHFFKSSSKKNKTASAATTPAQTPRSSMHEQRTSQPRMTQDEAMHMILKNTMTNAATGPFIR